MVMKPEPVFAATEAVIEMSDDRGPVILMTPVGRRFDHSVAVDLSNEKRLILICGHYEGLDARIHDHLATDELSIGDYVLSGGELPALVVAESVVRQLPGALGCADSAVEDSFVHGLLEAPQYTRPPEYRGWEVPEMLVSGHHQEIDRWRRRQNLLLTAKRRPDLLRDVVLSDDEREWLVEQGVDPAESRH